MKRQVIILGLLMCQFFAKAQLLDSLKMEFGTSLTTASKDYLPLWLVANRFGVISDQKFDASTNLKMSTSIRYGEEFLDIYSDVDPGYYIDLGVNIFNNSHLSNIQLQEAYLKVRHRGLEFGVGRFRQIIGEVDYDLSSGSLGISGNAIPIPKLALSLDYTDIPFTNSFVQFKGHIGHGWMGNHQYMKNAYLHEKSLYIRLGKKHVKFYGGVQHYAVWGGNRGNFKLDRSVSGFFNVLLVKEANDGSVPDGILPNRAGDHRGVLEAGVEWEGDNFRGNVNNQTPFDMGQGIDIRNIDRLISFNLQAKNDDINLKKITLEFIYTKQMNNFYPLKYRESYYNNGVYSTGWEYLDNIIGTPLFINRVRGSKYFDNIKPYNWDGNGEVVVPLSNIISNRVIGFHTGIVYSLTDNWTSKTLITYTRNYGDYIIQDFPGVKNQWYTLNQINYRPSTSNWNFFGTLGADFGQMSNNFGVMIGLKLDVLPTK